MKPRFRFPAFPLSALSLAFALTATAQIIPPGSSSGSSGSTFTNRLLTVLSGTTTTNRIWFTNSARAFGDTNAIYIKTNTSTGKWEWYTNFTGLAATNDLNRPTGTWHRITGTLYGTTRYDALVPTVPPSTSPGSSSPNPDLVTPTNRATAEEWDVPILVGDKERWVDLAARIAYVATNGSDASTTLGTVADPFATLTNALRRLGNNGKIFVRGGTYTDQSINLSNSLDLEIYAYANEIPNFWYGQGISAGSFSALSNGIYTATMSANFSNNLQYLAAVWDAWAPINRGVYLFQTNNPFGTNIPNGISGSEFYLPPTLSALQETNRCEHTPLLRAASVTSMVNSNGLWFTSGSTLYVKFAVSNVTGGIYLPATNSISGNSFISGATGIQRVKVQGIRVYFAGQGFNFSGCKNWEFRECLAFGSGHSGFHGTSSTAATGGGRIINCVGSAVNGFCFESEGTILLPMISIEEVGCVWHDYLREGSSARENVRRTVTGSYAFGGVGHYGFVDQGSSSTYLGCTTISNVVSGMQLGASGTVLGRRSFARYAGCNFYADTSGVTIDDRNDFVIAQNCSFNIYGVPLNVTANPTTHFVHATNCRQGSRFNGGAVVGAIIDGTGTSDTTRYIDDALGVGTSPNFFPGGVYGGNGAALLSDGSITVGSSLRKISSGSGSPEGSVTGNVGDIYLRTDSATSFYSKTNGTGNVGWMAK